MTKVAEKGKKSKTKFGKETNDVTNPSIRRKIITKIRTTKN